MSNTKKKVKYYLNSSNSWNDDQEFNTMAELLDNIDFSDESADISAMYADANSRVSATFHIKDGSDYCCGCAEVGCLEGNTLRIRAMNLLFNKLFAELNNKTIIITTITSQEGWEKYLTETTLFKAVKTFVNKNTGNTVTLWVSTNENA